MALIECKNLTKVYGQEGESQTHALAGASCSIEAGEFVAIMGPSGSGKSTLMQIMGFLDHQTEGSYFFDGKDVATLTDDERAYRLNQKVGFVFQSFNLLPRLSVFENVALPQSYDFYNKKIGTKEHQQKVMEALTSVSLQERKDHLPNQLSGGEKQRAAIARALVNEPTVIFADEPTGNLDSHSGLQVMRTLQALHKEGHTIILVTHESDTAQHAQRILQMIDGKIAHDQKVHDQRDATQEGELKK